MRYIPHNESTEEANSSVSGRHSFLPSSMDQGAPKTMVEYRPPSKPEAAGMEETGRRGSTITEKARRKSKLGAKPSGYENDLTGNTREANLSVPSDAFKSMDYFSKDGSLHNYGSIKQEEGKRGGSRVVEEVKVPLTVTVVSEVLAKGGPPPSEKRHPSAKSKLPRSPQPTTSHKAPVTKDPKPRKSMMNSTLPADRLSSFKKDPKGLKGGKGGKSSKKQERHVKMHIETLMKGRPIRFRVIAFA